MYVRSVHPSISSFIVGDIEVYKQYTRHLQVNVNLQINTKVKNRKIQFIDCMFWLSLQHGSNNTVQLFKIACSEPLNVYLSRAV